MVDTAFDTNFVYYREPFNGGGGSTGGSVAFAGGRFSKPTTQTR